MWCNTRMIKEQDSLIIIPFQSVGGFEFGVNIAQYQAVLADWEFEPTDEFGKAYYKSPDGNLILAIREQKIESIFCYQSVYYQGFNVIGLTVQTFENLSNAKPVGDIEQYDFEDDGLPQFVYEFESVGLQIWEKQGKIVTIIAGGKDNYSAEPFYQS